MIKVNNLQLQEKQREFGEQSQQAPIMGESQGFAEILVQSLFDQEMGDTSVIEKMPYLQSKMHFDESLGSNADSDLEDGEIRKLLTSSLCAQEASGETRCNGRAGERGKCTNVSLSEGQEATGNPLHCCHQHVVNKEPNMEFCVRKRKCVELERQLA